MTTKKLAIVTYGCQMNKYDSERIVGILQQANYELTEHIEQAHLVLLNTCSVREKAEQKLLSALGRYREHKARGRDCMVVMGHPKALTPYSLDRLERFLKRHRDITPATYANLA